MIYRESSPGVNYFDISDRLLIENYTSSAEFHGARGSRESRGFGEIVMFAVRTVIIPVDVFSI